MRLSTTELTTVKRTSTSLSLRSVAPNKLPRNVSVSNRNPVSRLRRRSPPSSVYLNALLTVRLTLPTKKARLPKKNPASYSESD